MGWRGPLTDRQLHVWLAWHRLFKLGDRDLDMDGCVPLAVQKRWEAKVGGAVFYRERGSILASKAREEAFRTGGDEAAIFDRLKAEAAA